MLNLKMACSFYGFQHDGEERFLLNASPDEILRKLVIDRYEKQRYLVRAAETPDAKSCFDSKDDLKLEAKKDQLLAYLDSAKFGRGPFL